MSKEYAYYVTYVGSRDTCLELHAGTLFFLKPIETLRDIRDAEELIYRQTGHEAHSQRAGLLGFFLLSVKDVRVAKVRFEEIEHGLSLIRLCS